MVQANFNILKRYLHKSIPIHLTFWWALGQLKCTYKVTLVVDDDSESGI